MSTHQWQGPWHQALAPPSPSRRSAGAALLTAAALLCAAAPLAAGAGSWTLSSIGGGNANALAVAPSQGGLVYAAMDGFGVVKSSRVGLVQTPWTTVSGGLDPNATINHLAVDPHDAGHVWAATSAGVLETVDGGATWHLDSGSPPATGLALAPSTLATLYVVGPSPLGPSVGDFLSRSTNGGETWQALGTAGLPRIFADLLQVSPADPDTIYVAGTTEPGPGPLVWKSTDGGGTWSEASAGLPPAAADFPEDLRIDPSSPSTLYLTTYASGLWRTVDGGRSWAALDTGLPPGSPFFGVAVDPAAPGTVYVSGGDPARLLKSSDGGASWIALPWDPRYGRSRELAIDVQRPGCLYVGLAFFAAVQSCDGGASWTWLHAGLEIAVALQQVLVDPNAAGTLYVSALLVWPYGGGYESDLTGLGVLKSVDGGATWSKAAAVAGALEPFAANRLVADPVRPATLYAGTDHGVLKTTDGGASWSNASTGLDLFGVADLALTPAGDVLYVAGSGAIFPPRQFPLSVTGVAKSNDGGATWTTLEGLPNSGEYTAVALDPANPSRVFAASLLDSYSGVMAIWRSDDAGATWAQLGAGLPTHAYITALRADPFRPLTLYAANAVAANSLFTSADGGATWTSIGGGLPAGQKVRGVEVGPDGATLFAATDQGVFLSTDRGATWESAGSGLQSPVLALAIDRRQGMIYAGTQGQGLGALSLAAGGCRGTDTALCLLGARFEADLAWRLPGGAWTPARSRSLNDGTGTFWFSSPDDLELAVKMIDGRAVNGHFWVYFAALSDVEYRLTVNDSSDGAVRTYHSARGHLTSLADVQAFAAGKAAHAPGSVPPAATGPAAAGGGAFAAAAGAGCAASDSVLCLAGARFAVSVAWRLPPGVAGAGRPLPLGDATGAFWFFAPAAADAFVKVVDGRAVNGHFWVFIAGLSDVAYSVSVTDTATGAVKTYRNAKGTLASRADTAAF